MFDPRTPYALNKRDPDAIVFVDANGRTTRLTRADFQSQEEFEYWKSWYDNDLHSEENGDHVYQHHTRPLNELTDAPTLPPEEIIEHSLRKQARQKFTAETVLLIREKLTPKQFRRLWLWCVDDLTTREIARIEGTSQQGISKSLVAAKKKILKNFPVRPEMGCQNRP